MSYTILWITDAASSPLSHAQHSKVSHAIASDTAIKLHICAKHQQAIAMAEQLEPTVIIQDMHMQGTHGLDLLRSYKKHPTLSAIPVIMAANNDAPRIRDYAFFRGCSDYIESTTNKQEWLSRIKQQGKMQLKSIEYSKMQTAFKQLKKSHKACKKALNDASFHDSLTGIANRQAFSQHYEREWSRALRETEPLSVLIVNIDHFKAFNDDYGYQQGDECLKKIANLLEEIFQRPTDFCARYCGEEFIVLLPMTNAQGGIYIAEKLRKAVIALSIPHKSSKTHQSLTLSLGLATTSPMLKHKSRELIRAADHARFEAKKQGRNRLICKSI